MVSDRLALAWLAAVGLALATSKSQAGEPPWVAGEATRSRLTVVGLDGSGKKVVLDSPHRYAAPDWSPDGKALIVNGGGKLWRLPATGGRARADRHRRASGWIDINHGISPDGKTLAFTAVGSLFREPARAASRRGCCPPCRAISTPGRPTASRSPIRPTGAAATTSTRSPPKAAPSAGSRPTRTPTTPPQYSPDGRWIYFLSDRAGNRDIWRMPADGAGPSDALAERITHDDRDDAAPHPSPDGKWLYLPLAPAPDRRQRRSITTS